MGTLADVYFVKVNDNGKEYLYPCDELGSTVFDTLDNALSKIASLKRKEGPVVYPDRCTFEAINRKSAEKLISYIKYNINLSIE